LPVDVTNDFLVTDRNSNMGLSAASNAGLHNPRLLPAWCRLAHLKAGTYHDVNSL
jgi:hypothetical protein